MFNFDWSDFVSVWWKYFKADSMTIQTSCSNWERFELVTVCLEYYKADSRIYQDCQDDLKGYFRCFWDFLRMFQADLRTFLLLFPDSRMSRGDLYTLNGNLRIFQKDSMMLKDVFNASELLVVVWVRLKDVWGKFKDNSGRFKGLFPAIQKDWMNSSDVSRGLMMSPVDLSTSIIGNISDDDWHFIP